MRRAPHSTLRAAAWLGLLLALPVQAQAPSQGGLDSAVLRRFAGTYAAACGDAAAARLRISADALVVEQGGQRLAARKPSGAYGYFGNSPPKNFQVALLGEARGGAQLVFVAYADAAGPYLLLDGDPRVTAALGRVLMAATYRRCGPAPAGASAPVEASAAPGATAAPAAAPELAALGADPAFQRAYRNALGPLAAERWLARFDGPAAPTRLQRFGGVPYVVIAVCKAHDCYDHSAVFVYSAAQRRVLGLVRQRGAKTLVGAPGPAFAEALERVWQAEWRQR